MSLNCPGFIPNVKRDKIADTPSPPCTILRTPPRSYEEVFVALCREPPCYPLRRELPGGDLRPGIVAAVHVQWGVAP